MVLGQTVVSRLPDVVRLGSEAEAATDEMRRLLLLVLGCAVQCSCKQKVVDNIKLMDYQTQHAIVECIQQVSRGLRYYCAIRCDPCVRRACIVQRVSRPECSTAYGFVGSRHFTLI